MTAKYNEGRVSIYTVVTKNKNAVPTTALSSTEATIPIKGGQSNMQNDVITTDKAQGETQALPQTYRKRIGSTVYVVSVHFSETSQETAEDKLLRLIKREVEDIV